MRLPRSAGSHSLNLRLVLACILAVAVGLPNAAVSIAKVLVVVTSLFVLLWPSPRVAADHAVLRLRSPAAIMAALVLLALTMLWATVPVAPAAVAWVKHAKLILIPLLVVLLRTRREALIALGCFAAAQNVQLLSSWLLVAGVPVAWATSETSALDHSVFSNYLGQSIMMAVFAAVCWHLRFELQTRWARLGAGVVIALALGNALFVMQGRTGHAVAIVLLSMAISWELPRRLRYMAVLVPFFVGAVLVSCSSTVRERATLAAAEAVAYIAHANNVSSSGERLNYWRRSVEGIAERPLTGFGVGSFNQEYNRIDAGRGNPSTFTAKNPHQEFLLWGFEAGIAGIVALCGVLLCLFQDARRGDRRVARATVSVLAALVVSSMFNSILFDAAIGDFFCVVIGLLLALGLRSQTERAAPTQRAAGA